MAAEPAARSWLAPALAVALLWAPLPGMAAVWFAVRAEAARGGEAFAGLAARARAWVAIAVLFGFVELTVFGSVGVARIVWTALHGGGW